MVCSKLLNSVTVKCKETFKESEEHCDLQKSSRCKENSLLHKPLSHSQNIKLTNRDSFDLGKQGKRLFSSSTTDGSISYNLSLIEPKIAGWFWVA